MHLTRIHSQKKPRLDFGKSFSLSLNIIQTRELHEVHLYSCHEGINYVLRPKVFLFEAVSRILSASSGR